MTSIAESDSQPTLRQHSVMMKAGINRLAHLMVMFAPDNDLPSDF